MTERTADLIARTRTGDRQAMAELLVAYLPQLHAFLRLNMGSDLAQRESSADLAQSVCREILADLDSFEYRGEASFKRWLFLTAERKLKDRGRFHRREQRALEREVTLDEAQLASGYQVFRSPSHAAIRQEEIGKLQSAFDRLPEEMRQVIVWAKFLDLSRAEIAERLGKSEGAVRVMLHRAIARLGLILDEEDSGTMAP